MHQAWGDKAQHSSAQSWHFKSKRVPGKQPALETGGFWLISTPSSVWRWTSDLVSLRNRRDLFSLGGLRGISSSTTWTPCRKADGCWLQGRLLARSPGKGIRWDPDPRQPSSRFAKDRAWTQTHQDVAFAGEGLAG